MSKIIIRPLKQFLIISMSLFVIIMFRFLWYLPVSGNVKSIDTIETTVTSNLNAKLLFLHIPKTGGSSVEEAALDHCNISWSRAIYIQNHTLKRHMKKLICNKFPDYCPEAAIWHIPLQFMQKALIDSNDLWDKQIYDNYFDIDNKVDYFCFIRNPYERILSEYSWNLYHPYPRMRPDRILSKYNWSEKFGEGYDNRACTPNALNYFLKIVLNMIINKEVNMCYYNCHYVPQYQYVYAVDNNGNVRQMCKYVFHSNTFRKEIDEMLIQYNILRLSSNNIPIRNQRNRRGCTHKLSVDDLNNESLSLIHKIYANDFQYLNFEMI
eukprot:153784_1